VHQQLCFILSVREKDQFEGAIKLKQSWNARLVVVSSEKRNKKEKESHPAGVLLCDPR